MANEVDNSSTDIPNAAAGAPAYWIALPNPIISNRDLLAAIWITSAIRVAFSATLPSCSPHVFNAPDTMLAVVSKFSPDATDASTIDGNELII